MSIEVVLIAIGLVLACIAQFQAQGKSLLGWAVIAVCVALLSGQLG